MRSSPGFAAHACRSLGAGPPAGAHSFTGVPLLVLCAVLSACVPARDGYFVDILVPGAEGLEVAEGEILDPVDPASGTGAGWAVRGAPTFSLHYLYDRALDGAPFSFADLSAGSRLDEGSALNLAFAYDPFSDRHALADEPSLVAATLMHHTSHILRDYREVYGERSGATHSPYLIGLRGALRLWDRIPVDTTLLGGDTAYHPFGDGVFFGATRPGHITPLPVSPGLVAHELQHRVMFHNLIVNGPWEAWTRIFRELDTDPNDPTTILPATHIAGNDMLRYRAFDEGVANLFGAAYSGNSNIYIDVYETPSEDQDMAVSVQTFWDPGAGRSCARVERIGAQSVESVTMSQDPYRVGSPVVARLWDAAGGDAETVRASILPALIEALDDIAADMRALSDEAGHFRFSLARAMNLIAAHLPPRERNAYCQLLGCGSACTLDVLVEPAWGGNGNPF